MTKQHDIEIITSSRDAVFRCRQCRADFRTVEMGVIAMHHAAGTLAEFYDLVRRHHVAFPPTRHLPHTSP